MGKKSGTLRQPRANEVTCIFGTSKMFALQQETFIFSGQLGTFNHIYLLYMAKCPQYAICAKLKGWGCAFVNINFSQPISMGFSDG